MKKPKKKKREKFDGHYPSQMVRAENMVIEGYNQAWKEWEKYYKYRLKNPTKKGIK